MAQNDNNLLVSVIVPTRNSEKFIEACLLSIKNQTYKNIEVIVIDNYSTDDTRALARKYSDKVFSHGPERSAQRNYGARESSGEYVLIVDSDMELSSNVVASCVKKMQDNKNNKSVIIPEESFGVGFWAQCKKLEKSYYIGVDYMEAARFFEKKMYLNLGGYNEGMVSGEDWDLSQRFGGIGEIGRIDDLIYHNEDRISLIGTIKKKYYYAGKFIKYTDGNSNAINIGKQVSIIGRYMLFFSEPSKMVKNPIVWSGLLFMKSCEFCFGGLGYFKSKINLGRRNIRILLLGTHGQNNIGDEILLEAFLLQLRKINNGRVSFYVNSYQPQQTAKNFGVQTFHTLKEKGKLLKYLFCADYVFFAGGSIIKELYSAYGRNTYSVMNMLMFLIGFAKKVMRKKIILSNIGIGPINTDKGFAKAGFILKNSDIVSVRDDISKDYGEKSYSETKMIVVPDAAFSLNRNYLGLPPQSEKNIKSLKDVNVIAFNLCRNISRPEVWGKFIEEMMLALVMIYDVNPTVKIIGLPMQLNYSCDDYETLRLFRDQLMIKAPMINFEIVSPRNTRAVARIIDESDLVVAERLHCSILATIINTPFISLEYDIKVKSFLMDIGLGINGIDISENFQAGKVFGKIQMITNNHSAQRDYLKTVSATKNILVNKYFTDLRAIILNKK